jgi:hypothetical protein
MTLSVRADRIQPEAGDITSFKRTGGRPGIAPHAQPDPAENTAALRLQTLVGQTPRQE